MEFETADILNSTEIGPMTYAEALQIFALARAEDWNPGTFDLACAWASDPEAFIALRHQEAMIAGGSIFRHSADFGFMGLFIVEPRYRGLGLGRRLWHDRLARLRARLAPDAVIAMDGVFEMERFYAAGGFVPAYATTRYEGMARPVPATAVDFALQIDWAPRHDAILALDRKTVPYDRTGLLSCWLALPETIQAMAIRDGELVGFGLARPASAGFKIGPLIAGEPQVARALLADMVARIEGHQIQIDVPAPNNEGAALALSYGLAPVFGCRRMYFGRKPAEGLSSVYAGMSLEFG
ncbi:MAG: GNAT family N-acetyltransferase [Novosphingobium sp.]|uniref:GNAT family N-acetyltransferase n=1 Tax=Novosphingobium sp. TaxID=1874826 RepID=UPI0030195FA2